MKRDSEKATWKRGGIQHENTSWMDGWIGGTLKRGAFPEKKVKMLVIEVTMASMFTDTWYAPN